MNRGIYAAATGMYAEQLMLDNTAHNLANLATRGFKASGLVFQDQFVRNLTRFTQGGEVIGSMGRGATLDREYTDFQVGSITASEDPLHVALASEKGMFAVQTEQGRMFTRDGSFQLNGNGELVTQSGALVLDQGGSPIRVPEANEIAVDESGQVLADGQPVGTIGVYDGSFRRFGNGLWQSEDASPMAGATVRPNALEGSNVNPIDSMVTMIKVQRLFEMAQKAIQSEDEQTQRLVSSLNG